MQGEVLEAISNRRSIRKYQDKDVPENLINIILEAGRWAPSGLNNQPWKFVIIKDPGIKDRLAGLTHYSGIVKRSRACIPVYFQLDKGYNRDKDLMSIGACIENMLLAAHSLGLGAVWLGEILNRKSEVNALLNIDDNFELMAVIALGWPDEDPKKNRVSLKELIMKKFI